MRSGFCSNGDVQHQRCTLAGCSCPGHAEPTATLAEVLDGAPESALTIAVEVAVRAAENLASASLAIGPDLSAEDALRRLHRLRVALEQIQLTDAALVRHIYAVAEHGDVLVDGLPLAKVTRGRDRKSWDTRGAIFAYLDQRLAETGESPDPMDVAAMVLDVAGVSYCKVTALRSMGLEPDAYCESSPGRLSVQFIG